MTLSCLGELGRARFGYDMSLLSVFCLIVSTSCLLSPNKSNKVASQGKTCAGSPCNKFTKEHELLARHSFDRSRCFSSQAGATYMYMAMHLTQEGTTGKMWKVRITNVRTIRYNRPLLPPFLRPRMPWPPQQRDDLEMRCIRGQGTHGAQGHKCSHNFPQIAPQ